MHERYRVEYRIESAVFAHEEGQIFNQGTRKGMPLLYTLGAHKII
jgi:hypothetical protein